MYACMYVCMYVPTGYVCMYIGMQRYRNAIIANTFPVGTALLPCTCSRASAFTAIKSPAKRQQRLGRLCAQQDRSSGSKERREHRREVHRSG